MAAYAALTSVVYILQQIQHHPRPPITIENQQMDSLGENVSFLQDFLEKHSHKYVGDGKEALESRIADAAYAAEDIIESHIVVQILAKSNFHEENNFIHLFSRGLKKMIRTLACSASHKTNQILIGDREMSSNSLFCQDLQKVIEDMNLIKKDVIEIQEKIRGINDDRLPTNIISMPAKMIGSSTAPPPKRKNTKTNTMVGFDDVLIQIMESLIGYPTNRQVLPIVGMGGIGKTTLARHTYDNPIIVKRFDIRIWITISQEYRLGDILIRALSSCQKDESKSTSEEELGVQLHKILSERRYLIVLDDVWSVEAWEKLMLFFPDNDNGSRIIVTTRLSNVADHFGPNGYKMNFLDVDKSWNLLCKITFPQDQCCPDELEEIGKKIASNCKGLPLSIVVIGGILANSGNTREPWEYVAKNLNSVVNLDDNEHCLNILYLSYNHLPIHLKPCFLYMGVFSEDSIISVPLLKKIWVAEGFLKPIAAKSLEEVAEEYLKDLIDRNLILDHELGSSGKVRYCKIHDLLRDLCLREGQKDKFLWVRTQNDLDNLEGIQSQRRISILEGTSKEKYHIRRVLKYTKPSASLARSLIFYSKGVRLLPHSFRLVRVFNNMVSELGLDDDKYKYSLKDIFKFVNLRYLEFATKWKSTFLIPSSILLLWNLQTLIIQGYGFDDNVQVPSEIWEMSQLRHLEIFGSHFSLPDPPNVPLIHEGDDDYFILTNLHSLKSLINFKLSKEVIKRIPNIKKLAVSYSDVHEGCWHNYCLNNLGLLNKLESLYIHWICKPQPSFRIEFLQNFALPHSLTKLTLLDTTLLWEDMTMIGSLPHLQVLKLRRNSFRGPEWNPVEGEFLCLKFLQIQWCDDLVYWNADRTHFPCLEKLVLDLLINLKEIPLDLGHISTLQFIELSDCMDSVAISAKNLQNEQVKLGNEGLQVRVAFHLEDTKVEGLASHNFQVETRHN